MTRGLETLERTFVVRANDVLIGGFAAAVLAIVDREAPGVRLCFAPEGDEDVAALRDGVVDLDVGGLGETGPEVRVQHLFRERLVGVIRHGHPLARGRVTPQRFAAAVHIAVSRRGRPHGPIDHALRDLGLARRVGVMVPSFYAALFATAGSDLVATLPERLAVGVGSRVGTHMFRLPLSIPEFAVTQAWHPRFDAGPPHRWLRGAVRRACT